MLITAEINKSREALALVNKLVTVIDSMAAENKEAKETLLKKVEGVKQDLLDGLTALEDLHS